MKKILLFALCLSAAGLFSCTKKKDRLVGDTLTIHVNPSIINVSAGASTNISAICRSAQTDNAGVSPSWTVDPASLGTFSPASGITTVFTAAAVTGTGKIYAAYSGIQGSGNLSVVVSTAVSGGGGTITLYSDSGLYADGAHIPDIPKWGSGSPANAGLVEQTSGGGAPGDTSKYERDTSGSDTFVGWGITLDKVDTTYKKDMSAFASGHIKFYLKTDRALTANERVFINVEEAYSSPATQGTKTPAIVIGTGYSWTNGNSSWQEVSVPVSDLTGISLANVHLPFEITVDGGGIAYGNPPLTSSITMDVDYVRWTSN